MALRIVSRADLRTKGDVIKVGVLARQLAGSIEFARLHSQPTWIMTGTELARYLTP